MKLVALMPVRDSLWSIQYTLPALLQWVDEAVVLLHRCKDGTAEFVRQLDRVTVLEDDDPSWLERNHRQRLLEAGRRAGGTHFVLIDSDEVLAPAPASAARAVIETLKPGEVLWARWQQLWRSLDAYRTEPPEVVPFAFVDAPSLAYHADADGYQLNRRHPFGTGGERVRMLGDVLHLQRCNWLRAQARQALYQMNEVMLWPNHRPGGVAEIRRRHVKSVAEPVELGEVPPAWWWQDGLDRSLIDLEAEPWELSAVRALLAEHGRERFAGLELFGLDACAHEDTRYDGPWDDSDDGSERYLCLRCGEEIKR